MARLRGLDSSHPCGIGACACPRALSTKAGAKATRVTKRGRELGQLSSRTCLEAQLEETDSFVLTMTSSGTEPPLKLLALGKCLNLYTLTDGVSN